MAIHERLRVPLATVEDGSSAISATVKEFHPAPLLALSSPDHHGVKLAVPRLSEIHVNDLTSLTKPIVDLERGMKASAKRPELEEAAALRDRIKELGSQQILKG